MKEIVVLASSLLLSLSLVEPLAAEVLGVSTADTTIHGSGLEDVLGWHPAQTGDINGDGYVDLLLTGSVGPNTAGPSNDYYELGYIYVFYGPLEDRVFSARSADAMIHGYEYENKIFQHTVADVNDDGFDDVVVPDAYYTHPTGEKGAVHFFHGPLAGTYSVHDASETFGVTPDGIIDDDAEVSAVTADDFNGDGIVDLAFSDYGFGIDNWPVGRVYIFLGPVDGRPDFVEPDGTWTGDKTQAYFGWDIQSAGDFDGDGLNDLIVGAPEPTQSDYPGFVYVISGPATGSHSTTEATLRIDGEAPLDRFGTKLSPGGDVNGDGISDILVGAWAHSSKGQEAGAAYFFYGPLSGHIDATQADSRIYHTDEYASMGEGLAIGDLNGDGRDEVVVAAPSYIIRNLGLFSGAAYIFDSHSLSAEMDQNDATVTYESPVPMSFAGMSLSIVEGLYGEDGTQLVLPAPLQSLQPNGIPKGAVYIYDDVME